VDVGSGGRARVGGHGGAVGAVGAVQGGEEGSATERVQALRERLQA